MDNILRLHIHFSLILSLSFQKYSLEPFFLQYILLQVLLNTNIYYLYEYYLLQEYTKVLEKLVLYIRLFHF